MRERVDVVLAEQTHVAEQQAEQTLSLQTQIDALRAQKIKTEKTVRQPLPCSINCASLARSPTRSLLPALV